MMSINLNDIAVLNFEASDYLCIISLISKSDAINLMQIADLTEKSGALWKKWKIVNQKIYKNFLKHIWKWKKW